MTDAISYSLSESERSVVDYARRLANVPVENQHETYFAGLLGSVRKPKKYDFL